MFLVLVVLSSLAAAHARKGFGSGEQDWGYVTVRDGAHMFWWLYYTSAEVNYTKRPLIVWLQGGPGASSSGYGNFEEVGTLDTDLNERNFAWTKNANMLFVDNPVGVGFSYVDSTSHLAKTNKDIAVDFVNMLKGFYREHPEFIPVPLYIIGESYGGKMATEIALVLDKAIEEGKMKSNFIGIGLGDSWVDPITTILHWAPYLLAIGAVDQAGYDAIAASASHTKLLYDEGHYIRSSFGYSNTAGIITRQAAGVDFYNILMPIPYNEGLETIDFLYTKAKNLVQRGQAAKGKLFGKLHTRSQATDKLEMIMPLVKEVLGVNITWVSQSATVSKALRADFMRNVTAVMQELLNTTNVKVSVYNGQLDLIVCTPGILIWLDNLEWSGKDAWTSARRRPFTIDGIYEGYEKILNNLAMFWVNRAGHMVPADNPAAMDHILRWLTQDYDGTVKRT